MVRGAVESEAPCPNSDRVGTVLVTLLNGTYVTVQGVTEEGVQMAENGATAVPLGSEITVTATLTLKVNTAGDGNPACAGFVTADEAKAFYTGIETVKLEAVPQPGYVFSHWQGRGNAFIADDHDDPTDERSLESETSPITNDEIWITMRDQDGLASRDVTAVFEALDYPNILFFCAALCLPQQRSKIGIGERVLFGTLADNGTSYDGEVTWAVFIPGRTPVFTTSTNTSFTAPRYAETYTISVSASKHGCVFYQEDFKVLVPNGERTQYSDWTSSYTQLGLDWMGGNTIYDITTLPDNACFDNVDFKELDSETTKDWHNSSYFFWGTKSGGEYSLDCNNGCIDIFSEVCTEPEALLIGAEYRLFLGEHDFENFYQVESGDWVSFINVTSNVEFYEVYSIGPLPEDTYHRYPMKHNRNGVPGPEIGSWQD